MIPQVLRHRVVHGVDHVYWAKLEPQVYLDYNIDTKYPTDD